MDSFSGSPPTYSAVSTPLFWPHFGHEGLCQLNNCYSADKGLRGRNVRVFPSVPDGAVPCIKRCEWNRILRFCSDPGEDDRTVLLCRFGRRACREAIV